ncbi:tetratricopeptide repeat protein [Chloroflexota bacterium]
MIAQLGSIDTMLNMLTRIMDSSLDYWLGRLVQPDLLNDAQITDQGIEIISEHRACLFTLIRQASPLLDTQRKAIQLALLITPVLKAQGYLSDWLPVVQNAAVKVYGVGFADRVLVADLWRVVADCYLAMGDLTRSEQGYQMAAEIAVGTMTEAGMDLYHDLRKETAALCARQFRFEEAEAIAEELLVYARKTRDILTIARGRILLAYVYLQEHRFKDAFASAQQAYILWRHLGIIPAQARALHYMGEAARLTKLFDRAALYLDMAVKHVQQLNEPTWHALLLQSLGSLALEQKRYDAAMGDIDCARDYFRQSCDQRNLLNSTHSLGVAKSRAGQYAEAEVLLLEAADGWSQLGSSWKLAEVYYALGKTYSSWGEIHRAKMVICEARKMMRRTNVQGDSCLSQHIDNALAQLKSQ